MTDLTAHTERIKYLVELLRLSWLTLLAIGSGTIGALLAEPDRVSAILAAAGSGAVLVLIFVVLLIDSRIRFLLPMLKSE